VVGSSTNDKARVETGVGDSVGEFVDFEDGKGTGALEGRVVGAIDGDIVGEILVGNAVVPAVGISDQVNVGVRVGRFDGCFVGFFDGT